jgi:hypothetical protein
MVRRGAPCYGINHHPRQPYPRQTYLQQTSAGKSHYIDTAAGGKKFAAAERKNASICRQML